MSSLSGLLGRVWSGSCIKSCFVCSFDFLARKHNNEFDCSLPRYMKVAHVFPAKQAMCPYEGPRGNSRHVCLCHYCILMYHLVLSAAISRLVVCTCLRVSSLRSGSGTKCAHHWWLVSLSCLQLLQHCKDSHVKLCFRATVEPLCSGKQSGVKCLAVQKFV